jgi:PRTRC genetic system protein E
MNNEDKIKAAATAVLSIANDGDLPDDRKIETIEKHLRGIEPTFFTQLAETLDADVDLNFTIRKNPDLTMTISIMPVVQKTAKPEKSWRPVVGTNNPKVLDEQFFEKLAGAIKASEEFIHSNAEKVKAEAEEQKAKRHTPAPKRKKSDPKGQQSDPADTETVPKCRECGCTEDNCTQCVEKTGKPCHWVETDLCSACVKTDEQIDADLTAESTDQLALFDPTEL